MLQDNQDGLNPHITNEALGRHVRSFQVQAPTEAQAEAEATARAEAPTSATEALSRIRATVRSVNPLRLLSRICIQCDFHEASEAGTSESYASQWANWSEVVARLVGSGDCVVSCSVDPTTETIDTLSRDFNDYWRAITLLNPAGGSAADGDTVDSLAAYSRAHAMIVKHDAPPYQLYEAAARLYSPRNDWLNEKLHFTIQEALATMHGIYTEVYSRINSAIGKTAQGFASPMTRETGARAALLTILDKNPDLAVFTEDEIVAICGVSREACTSVLRRFTWHVEDRPDGNISGVTPGALQLPFEFKSNQIHQRPLIEIGGRYVCPELVLLFEAVFLSLNFDLMNDKAVRGTYGNDRGAWLEQSAGEYLAGVYGSESVCVNPYRDDGNELCDVLVYYDNTVIVVSCKAKMLTAAAEYGNGVAELKDDLQKSIGDSYVQVEGALAYLKRSGTVNILHQNQELWKTVDSTQLDAVIPIYVLPNTYQNLTINVRDIVSSLGLRVDSDNLPWIVSVFDLQHAAEMLDESPGLFLHYLECRRRMALGRTRLEGTEMDLLGHYLIKGLSLGPGSEYGDYDVVALGDFSAPTALYLRKVHELGGIETSKPRSGFPLLVSGLAHELAETGVPHRTVSLLRLLELPITDQAVFLNHVTQCRKEALATSKPASRTIGIRVGPTMLQTTYWAGVSGASVAVRQAEKWAQKRWGLHGWQTREWVCLVGDATSDGRVESVIHVPPHSR